MTCESDEVKSVFFGVDSMCGHGPKSERLAFERCRNE